jgi:arylsulfatase A
MHGPGTVRSGKWKFYPWQEGKGNQKRDNADWEPSTDPVQLYDTSADIGETTNIASQHPYVVRRLQAAYDSHVAELTANQRPTAELIRPTGALSPARPSGVKKKRPRKTTKKS